MFSSYIGYVTAVTDNYHAERIKAVITKDKGRPLSKIPYAFPLLPKMIHVKPKVGEAVVVLIPNDGSSNEQRYYIGPIISQPQKMAYDGMASLSATKLLNGGFSEPDNSIDNNPLSSDIFPENDEVAILGRKNSEIIIGDDDIRLRCGVRVTNDSGTDVSLNGKSSGENSGFLTDSSLKTAPAFVKLKYHKGGIETTPGVGDINPHTETLSTATIVADKINLISPSGDGHFSLPGSGEAITDTQMKKIIEMSHKLPYGDVLCEFLSGFLQLFIEHVHPYPGLPPIQTTNADSFINKFPPIQKKLEDTMLSKDVGIN